LAREKKRQEQIELTPTKTLQPKSRSIRYDNMKSAMAEETVIAMVLRDPSLFDGSPLKGSDFSVPLLGKVYDQFCKRYAQHLDVSLGVLSDLEADEMSHIASISSRQQGPASEKAFMDCVQTIRKSSQASSISSDDDLLAFRNKLKESKGTK